LLAEALEEPALDIDCELPFERMTPATMSLLDRLAPFGAANDAPVFLSRSVHLAEPPRTVGADNRHVLLHLRKGEHVLKSMAFGMAPRLAELQLGRPLDVVFTPKWNTFRGATNLEAELHDFEGATA
jgi:single-stranded-DNA-specific exonuclease